MFIKLNSALDIAEFVYIALGYPDAITVLADENSFSARCVCNLELLKGKRIYVQFFYTQESDIRRQFYQKISKWRVE